MLMLVFLFIQRFAEVRWIWAISRSPVKASLMRQPSVLILNKLVFIPIFIWKQTFN